MGSIVKLEEAKLQCHVELEDTTDDALLTKYIKSAEQAVLRHLGYTDVADLVNREPSLEVPEPVRQAVLLLVATWYGSRETVTYGSVTEMPNCYDYLVNLFRNYNS
jgi:uncharacterized phage protein (predicted DNA packaging)